MKKVIFTFFVAVIFYTHAQSQPHTTVDSSKYRINLPDYWKPGNKVWQVLTDKLPLVCPELNDREICGDGCRPLFSIEMILTRPLIYDYTPVHLLTATRTESWQFQTWFSFECSLLLFNDRGNILTRLIIVDTNEVWRVTNNASLAAYIPPKPVKFFTSGRNPQPIEIVVPTVAVMGETPYDYINKNRGKLAPSLNDLFMVVDNKIRSW